MDTEKYSKMMEDARDAMLEQNTCEECQFAEQLDDGMIVCINHEYCVTPQHSCLDWREL